MRAKKGGGRGSSEVLIPYLHPIGLQELHEGLERFLRLRILPAGGAIELNGIILLRCVDRQMAGDYEGVDAYAAPHGVVLDPVMERVLALGPRQLHLRPPYGLQGGPQEALLVGQVGLAAVERRHDLLILVHLPYLNLGLFPPILAGLS
jgi:hypothetical protein